MWTQRGHRATQPMVMFRIDLEFKAKKCWDYDNPDNTPNDENGDISENFKLCLNQLIRLVQLM